MDLIPVNKDINPFVIGILLNNLLINSIKHNLPAGGFIHIRLDQRRFAIKNSSVMKEIDKKHLFERFKSYSTNPDSIGLGLSIIKKITDILGWEISYEYKDNSHSFEVTWP